MQNVVSKSDRIAKRLLCSCRSAFHGWNFKQMNRCFPKPCRSSRILRTRFAIPLGSQPKMLQNSHRYHVCYPDPYKCDDYQEYGCEEFSLHTCYVRTVRTPSRSPVCLVEVRIEQPAFPDNPGKQRHQELPRSPNSTKHFPEF